MVSPDVVDIGSEHFVVYLVYVMRVYIYNVRLVMHAELPVLLYLLQC